MEKNMLRWIQKILPWAALVILPCILMLPLMLTHQLHYKVDMWFHMMRIQEMNGYFQTLTWPGLGNIYSFGQSGQLIQGMYPSFTLAILVFVTGFLSAMNQMYAIILLMIILMSSAYFWVFKKFISNDFISFISAVIVTYPMAFICAIERGQFGLVLASVFLPMIFYGLYKVQSSSDKSGFLYIGTGVGLIWLTHVSSGVFVVILVMVMGAVDLILGRKNFLQYVKAGILAGVIALPTLVKLLMMNSSVMSVVEHSLDAKIHLLTIFSPLWTGGRDFMTVLPMIGLIYVIATVYRKSTFKTMKVTAIILALMCSSAGYLIFLRPLQFQDRFLAYALPLAMFIMLIEAPKFMRGWTEDNKRIVYLLLVFLAIVPAANSALRVKDFVSKHPVWQVEQNFLRTKTTADKDTLASTKFRFGRTYTDYTPIQQAKTAEKGDVAYVGSKQMKDVNEAQSVRLTGFNNDDIKMKIKNAPKHIDNEIASKNYVVPYQPATNLHAEKRTLTMDVNVSEKGQYDLPFWMYPHLGYTVTVNNKAVAPYASNQGRMSVPLEKGKQTVSITQDLPVVIVLTYMISWSALIASMFFMWKMNKKTKRKSGESDGLD